MLDPLRPAFARRLFPAFGFGSADLGNLFGMRLTLPAPVAHRRGADQPVGHLFAAAIFAGLAEVAHGVPLLNLHDLRRDEMAARAP
jgi:hypothetical protein